MSPDSSSAAASSTLEVDRVPYECSVVGLSRMMFDLLRKMKREMMVAEAFVLFFPVTIEINGGS